MPLILSVTNKTPNPSFERDSPREGEPLNFALGLDPKASLMRASVAPVNVSRRACRFRGARRARALWSASAASRVLRSSALPQPWKRQKWSWNLGLVFK
jgi:hypothetical protein